MSLEENEDRQLNFIFDVVISKLEMFSSKIQDPTEVEIQLKFLALNMRVTGSRINVTEFVNNRSAEFMATASEVRRALNEAGITLVARYQGSTLGSGTLLLPDTVTDQIYPNMRDLIYQDTTQLMSRVNHVGNATVLIIFRTKCEEVLEPIPPAEGATGKAVSKKPVLGTLGTSFNEQDILFVIGDPDPLLKIPSEPCSELAPEEGDPRLKLDLARYASLENRRAIFPDDDPCPKMKPSFTSLKKLTQHYSQIIDSVSEKIKTMECQPLPPSSVPTTEPPSEWTCPSHKTPFEEIKADRWIPIPVRPKDDYGVEPIRFCPVCLHSMSWMPKYAPCPRCLTKTRPVLEGHPSKILTAEEIMAEQLKKPVPPPGADDFCLRPCDAALRDLKDLGSDDECPPCRCTCRDGKCCAHCRIRAMCEDIFNRESPEQIRKRSTIRPPEPGSSEDFCVVAESEGEYRPYLTRVFSQLKDLYKLHDSQKIEAIQKRCESESLMTLHIKTSKASSKSTIPTDGRIPGIPEPFHIETGHKECVPEDILVPRNHGWSWPKSYAARKRGWRPGAILRTAGHVMRYFLTRRSNQNICQKVVAKFEEDERNRLPVLNITKRFGEIYVTLRPLPTSEIKQKPIVFRIVKSDLAVALREMKRALKDQGFRKCTCHKPVMMCVCRDALEKFVLNKALKKECQKRLMEPCPEHLVLTDTSDSEMEFDLDVNPPCRPRRKVLRKTVNHFTQTSNMDNKPAPPKYPKRISPYYRRYDCAVGARYMGTAMGKPGEQVFEDGLFGLLGGGPHGPNPTPCGRKRLKAAWGAGGGFNAMFGGGRGNRDRGLSGVKGALPGADKLFPKKPTRPIPVRFPNRFLKPGQDAAKAAIQAEKDAIMKKKKGVDMIKYLQKEGTISRPWNPDEGKDTRPKKSVHGPDRLTGGERKLKLLLSGPRPLLCSIPRRAKGYDPCLDPCRYEYVC
ncbi:hypothetical protein KR026_006342 [Drosophila bipectinata]|nr:hypothetical protein KR026_006342 [Drosophila bipectinata]